MRELVPLHTAEQVRKILLVRQLVHVLPIMLGITHVTSWVTIQGIVLQFLVEPEYLLLRELETLTILKTFSETALVLQSVLVPLTMRETLLGTTVGILWATIQETL